MAMVDPGGQQQCIRVEVAYALPERQAILSCEHTGYPAATDRTGQRQLNPVLQDPPARAPAGIDTRAPAPGDGMSGCRMVSAGLVHAVQVTPATLRDARSLSNVAWQ